jgi:hypothetical protein
MTDNSEIRAAYENAGHMQLREYPKLPRWEDLPIEMREMIIHIFYAGRKAAAREQKEQRRRLAGGQ